jgi:hypothetical protein
MKNTLPFVTLSSLLVVVALPAAATDFPTPTDLYTANTPLSSPLSSYSGNVGIRFGLDANKVPGGDTVQVTDLGFYAGTPGQFTGAGTVDFDHTLSLWGPQSYANRAGNYGSLNLASMTLSAGTTVDADGFAWVQLSAPLTLIGGDYYVLLASYTSGQTADPYFNPYSGASGAATLLWTPDNPTTANSVYTIGRYGTGSGQEAYGNDGYLGSNLKFTMIPEPATLALGLLGGLTTLILGWRGRR